MSGFEYLISECEKNIDFYTNTFNTLRSFIKQHEEGIAIISESSPNVDFEDFEELEHIYNYTGYVTISILDLSVNLKYLVISKTDWEKIFFIKNSYLIIYETAKKISPFKSKSSISLSVENNFPLLQGKLYELLNDIEKFRESDNYKTIKETRHKISGHIHDSLKTYYNTTQKLNGEDAGKIINDFLIILNKAFTLLKDYAEEVNTRIKEKSKAINENLISIYNKIQRLMPLPYNLQRFLDAQQSDYATALAEIKRGRKQSHWMWYIFPQIQGLGFSETSRFYAIKNLEEATAYLQHPVLGSRLVDISNELLSQQGNDAHKIFGSPDDVKLKSSMTLFASVPVASPVFQQVLHKFFNDEKDNKTLQLLNLK